METKNRYLMKDVAGEKVIGDKIDGITELSDPVRRPKYILFKHIAIFAHY